MSRLETREPLERAVQLHHPRAAHPPVQPVHVLRHDDKLGDDPLQRHQGMIARVRDGRSHQATPPHVPSEHPRGIATERRFGRELFGVVARPQAGERVPKCGDAGVARHPRTGGHHHAAGGSQRSRRRLNGRGVGFRHVGMASSGAVVHEHTHSGKPCR